MIIETQKNMTLLFKLSNERIKIIFGVLLWSVFAGNLFSQQIQEDFKGIQSNTTCNAPGEVTLASGKWEFFYVQKNYNSFVECAVLSYCTSGELRMGYIITPVLNAPQTISFDARLSNSTKTNNFLDVQVSIDNAPFTSVAMVEIVGTTYQRYTVPINSSSNNVRVKFLRSRVYPSESTNYNIMLDNIGIATSSTVNCGSLVSFDITQPTCGGSNGSINLVPKNAHVCTAVWQAPSIGQITTNTLLNVAAGEYSVEINCNNVRCDTTITITDAEPQAVNFSDLGTINITQPTCGENNGSINLIPNDASCSVVWKNAANEVIPNTSNTLTDVSATQYNVKIDCGCQFSDTTINITEGNAQGQELLMEDFNEYVFSTQQNKDTIILHGKKWYFNTADDEYSSGSANNNPLDKCVILRHSGGGNTLKLGYFITPAVDAPQVLSFDARLQNWAKGSNSVEIQISEDGGPWKSVDTVVIQKSESSRQDEPFSKYSVPINSTSNNVKIKVGRMRHPVSESSDVNILIDNINIAEACNRCKLDCNLPALQDMCNENKGIELDASVSATGYVSYRWSNSDTTAVINVSKPGVYSVIITNSCGQSITRQVQVRSMQEMGVYGKDGNLMQSTNMCHGGDSIQLYADAGAALSYRWTPTDGLNNAAIFNPKASPAASTTYNVQITTAGGCRINKTVYVNVSQPFKLEAGENNRIECKGKSIAFDVSGADAYRWFPKDGLSCYDCPNPRHTVLGNKTYTVTGIKDGCLSSQTISVTSKPDELFFSYTNNGCNISFNATENTEYSDYKWTFGDGTSAAGSSSVNHTYTIHGTYYVCVEAVNDCGAQMSHCIPVKITQTECPCQLPNCK